MKRSEMVKVIEQAFIDCDEDDFDVASFILNAIEKAGMLPPYNKNHGIDNFSMAMGVSVDATHKWEAEDE